MAGIGAWSAGSMNEAEMNDRTKALSLRIIKLVSALPNTRVADTIGRQLLRAGTSVGANYRAARKDRSRAEFISKLRIVEEEADNCVYWLELLAEAGIMAPDRLKPLRVECDEIVAIVVAAIRTARRKRVGQIPPSADAKLRGAGVV